MTTPVAFIGHLTAGRAQMGTSLAFHLTFAVLGVGLPLMMLMAEGMHLRTGDPVWRALARRWAKALAVRNTMAKGSRIQGNFMDAV